MRSAFILFPHCYPRLLVLACVLALASIQITGHANRQEIDPRLQKVLAQWENRRNAMKGVRYEVEATITITAQSILREKEAQKKRFDPSKISDVHLKFECMLLMDFQSNRHRIELRQQRYHTATGEVSPPGSNTYLGVFDGTKSMYTAENTYSPKGVAQAESYVSILTGDQRRARLDATYMPLFLGHGIVRIDKDFLIPGKLLTMQSNPKLLSVHGEAVYEGRPCLVLRAEPTRMGRFECIEEYWVDTTRDGAVVRQIQYANGEPWKEMRVEYEGNLGHWLVKAWNWSLYSATGGGGNWVTLDTRRFEVKKTVVNPSVADSEFTIPLKPGMMARERQGDNDMTDLEILNSVDPPPRYYQVQDDGTLREVSPERKQAAEGQVTAVAPRSKLWSWILILLIFSLGIGLYLRQRLKSKDSFGEH